MHLWHGLHSGVASEWHRARGFWRLLQATQRARCGAPSTMCGQQGGPCALFCLSACTMIRRGAGIKMPICGRRRARRFQHRLQRPWRGDSLHCPASRLTKRVHAGGAGGDGPAGARRGRAREAGASGRRRGRHAGRGPRAQLPQAQVHAQGRRALRCVQPGSSMQQGTSCSVVSGNGTSAWRTPFLCSVLPGKLAQAYRPRQLCVLPTCSACPMLMQLAAGFMLPGLHAGRPGPQTDPSVFAAVQTTTTPTPSWPRS